MATRLEQTILKNLIQNEPFIRKTLPYIKSDFFQERDEEFLYKQIKEYFLKYQTPPTPEALIIDIDDKEGVDQQLISDTMVLIREIKEDRSETPDEWLVDSTEKWCKDRAVYNGVMSSISIIQDKEGQQGQIPDILREALSVSFDSNIGHDFIEDWDSRYEFMHREEERIPFDLELMNKITKGGLPNKTLNICMAGTGVGKSLFMCHCASASLLQGNNVLYITMEMAEEKIAERIDANLLDISLNDLQDLPKMMYEKKITRVREKTKGKLIIKEYPTATAHSGHFRHLLQELDLKIEELKSRNSELPSEDILKEISETEQKINLTYKKIFSKIVHDWDKVETNYKLMNLKIMKFKTQLSKTVFVLLPVKWHCKLPKIINLQTMLFLASTLLF